MRLIVSPSMHRLVVVGALAFLSGWADVLCIVRFGTFASMQTGNAVMVGRGLSDGTHAPADGLYYVCVMVANMLGSMGYEVLHRTMQGRRGYALTVALLILATGAMRKHT